jgi:hypothetical protein
LPGGLTVLVVRDGATYVVTHRLTLAAAEGRRLSRVRAPIEAVMKVWKDPRRLTGGKPAPTGLSRIMLPAVWSRVVSWSEHDMIAT